MEALGMGAVGAGYIGNDGVLIVDRPEQADAVAEAMRKKDAALGPQHVLQTVRTLSSTLPADQKTLISIRQPIQPLPQRLADLDKAFPPRGQIDRKGKHRHVELRLIHYGAHT